MKKERRRSRDSQSLEALRATFAEQRGTGSLPAQRLAFTEDESPPIGWPIWLAWVFGLLALLVTAAAGMFLGLAALTPLAVNQTLLTAVLLGPVVGGAVALPGVVFALLATRRGQTRGARVAAPVTLVGLSTVVLIGGLLFGGLVAYPRYQLGTFGQAIQAHCARFAQSLEVYGNPPDISKIQQDPLGMAALLQRDEAALPGDQSALDALTAPDPKYQPLLDDCRSLTVKDSQSLSSLQSELVSLTPNLTAARMTLTQYQTNTSSMLAQIQQLGAALKAQVYAPFHPG